MADQKLDRRVKLSAALPAEDAENGLDHLADALTADPEGSMILALVVLDVKSVNHDILQDVYVPMLRIREVEAVLRHEAPESLTVAMAEMRAERRRNAGQEELIGPDLLDHLEDAAAIVPADADVVLRNPFRSVK